MNYDGPIIQADADDTDVVGAVIAITLPRDFKGSVEEFRDHVENHLHSFTERASDCKVTIAAPEYMPGPDGAPARVIRMERKPEVIFWEDRKFLKGRFPACRFAGACDAAIDAGCYPAYFCQCHHGRKEGDADFAVEAMERLTLQYGD